MRGAKGHSPCDFFSVEWLGVTCLLAYDVLFASIAALWAALNRLDFNPDL